MSDLQWIAYDGTITDLNSFASGYVLAGQPTGLGMPPTSAASSTVFDQPGELLEAVHLGLRDVMIPLGIVGDSRQSVDVGLAYLARQMNPAYGFGALRVERESGDARLLVCRYSSGLEGTMLIGEAPTGDLWIEPKLDLRAYDPYLIDEADTVLTFGTTGGATWFGHPWFPLQLGSSTVFADATISNSGDDYAWPVFTIRGPATNPRLTNVTTGAVIDLSAGSGVSLAAGDVLVIDTRPNIGTIVKTAGAVVSNAWPAMTTVSDLWPLVRGDNTVRVAVGGANASSAVEVAYRLRYLTA